MSPALFFGYGAIMITRSNVINQTSDVPLSAPPDTVRHLSTGTVSSKWSRKKRRNQRQEDDPSDDTPK
jgi:hypothetical protein